MMAAYYNSETKEYEVFDTLADDAVLTGGGRWRPDPHEDSNYCGQCQAAPCQCEVWGIREAFNNAPPMWGEEELCRFCSTPKRGGICPSCSPNALNEPIDIGSPLDTLVARIQNAEGFAEIPYSLLYGYTEWQRKSEG